MTLTRQQVKQLHTAVKKGLPLERAWYDARYWAAKQSEREVLNLIKNHPGATTAFMMTQLDISQGSVAMACLGLLELDLVKRRKVLVDEGMFYRYWSIECEVSLEDEY
jgi:hypothetical protein